MTHFRPKEYGFEYGSAEVTRICSGDPGWVLFDVKTPKHPTGLQIYVTQTGKIRVHSEGLEWRKDEK